MSLVIVFSDSLDFLRPVQMTPDPEEAKFKSLAVRFMYSGHKYLKSLQKYPLYGIMRNYVLIILARVDIYLFRDAGAVSEMLPKF